jgi:hypothetical protein
LQHFRPVTVTLTETSTQTGFCHHCKTFLPVSGLQPFNPAGNLACNDVRGCRARINRVQVTQAGHRLFAITSGLDFLGAINWYEDEAKVSWWTSTACGPAWSGPTATAPTGRTMQ